MATSKLNQLGAVLNLFSINDLYNIAMFEFPETSWDELRTRIIKYRRETFLKKNIIRVLLLIVQDLDDAELQSRISNLMLYAIAKTQKRTWTAYALKNKEGYISGNTLQDIRSAIKRTGLLADVNMIKYDGKYVISVTKKIIRRGQGLKTQSPIYFQYFLNQSYIFASRKISDNTVFSGVVTGLGYKSFNYCYLNGPNVRDLLQLLRNKEGAISCGEMLMVKPDLNLHINEPDSEIIEYSQYKKRARFCDEYYGEAPPRLHEFSVTVKKDIWQSADDIYDMNGTSLDGMELTLKSPNIVEFIKELITSGTILPPVPIYMQNILKAGKNQIKISQ